MIIISKFVFHSQHFLNFINKFSNHIKTILNFHLLVLDTLFIHSFSLPEYPLEAYLYLLGHDC